MMASNSLATKTDSFDLAKPTDVIGFSNKLKDLIVEKKLYANIKGKNYPLVEAWQIAGALCGIYPEVKSLEDLSNGNTIKYRSEVVLKDSQGKEVGAGIAICTNKEQGKQKFEEYAIASMAQTRAVGKAFRIKLGWLVKLAGYEATPAEEMDAIQEAQTVEKAPRYTIREISYATSQLEHAKSMDELKVLFATLGDIRKEPKVIAKKDELKAKFQKGAESEQNQEG